MILHIMYDEKIISRTISEFETALPGGNKFIIIMARNVKPKYVLENEPYIIRTKSKGKTLWKAVGDVSVYDYIILHNLGAPSVNFINHINHPRIVWCAWGADLYGGFLAHRGYNLHYDENLVQTFSNSSKPFYQKIIDRIINKYQYIERVKALKKISYISTIDNEIELLKRYYPEAQHIEKKHFMNYTVDEVLSLDQLENNNIGNDIVIGNSASLNGNHCEVFKALSELDLGNRNLIVPLSYGNMKYKSYVMNLGKSMFGELFKPLTEFLPLNIYFDTMQNARTFIYGNYRQEGMGNVVMALCWGSAIFLHPSNVLLAHFKSMGCTIFSTEDLPAKIHYKLTEEEKRKNKEIIFNYYNKERLFRIIRERFGPNSY